MTLLKYPMLTPEFLTRRYVDEIASREEIATEVGCSIANIQKRLRDWKILRSVTRKKAGLFVSWNKGLTKETDERLAGIALARTGDGNPMYGKPAWNAGVSAEDDLRVKRMVVAMQGGFDSPETRKKMSLAKTGLRGKDANNWKGGTTPCGAYSVHRRTVDGRRMYAHRYKAEKCLKRVLTTLEHVHHIDRDEANNAAENLLVILEADHATLHGGIYRGECDTRVEQIEWLTRRKIKFEELYED